MSYYNVTQQVTKLIYQIIKKNVWKTTLGQNDWKKEICIELIVPSRFKGKGDKQVMQNQVLKEYLTDRDKDYGLSGFTNDQQWSNMNSTDD